jgi:hypothetical protein
MKQQLATKDIHFEPTAFLLPFGNGGGLERFPPLFQSLSLNKYRGVSNDGWYPLSPS